MQVQAITPYIGAEITQVDIKDASQHEALVAALGKYGVIVLRDQQLTPMEQIQVAERFGSINVNRFFQAHPEHPQIAMVVKTAEQQGAVGESWHTDHSYDQEPAAYSMLYAKQVPDCGGDTLFVSTTTAYDQLSPSMQNYARILTAGHSSRQVFGFSQVDTEQYQDGRLSNAELAIQDALHPVVIKHPICGRPSLYVNPQFTTHVEGLTELESDAMLAMLFAHMQQPEFNCRVKWQPNTLTMWDNRATWHKAMNDYQGQARTMHRITINGDKLHAW